jgi:glycosyltransferase involved in cell wall biosynthesis
MTVIEARVGLQQRVLPEYRTPFFNLLGQACIGGLEVFAGLPRSQEAITTSTKLTSARFVRARNMHLFSGKTYSCIQGGFIHWLETWQPQVLIVEANPRYLSTPLAIQWMHRRQLPVIGWGLGAPKTGRAENLLRREFLQNLDALIAYSQSGAEQYVAAGFNKDCVFVAPNAVSPRPTQPAPQRKAEYKGGKPSILFLGRLQERKRIDQLLQACARLPIQLQPHLVIVGDGPDRERLQELADRVFPSAQFPGAKHGQELEPYFNTADLFVLPGTGGLAVQQAMAHALPVLVGEADGTQSSLVRPGNGWMLTHATVEDLADKLAYALEDVSRLRRMGAESLRIVSEEVNLETMVESFVQAISTVLEG